MRSVESEGDSIDEAIANALRALELSRDRVEIEILSDATRGGLFGFGGKKARVRATVRAPLAASRLAEPEAKVSREAPSDAHDSGVPRGRSGRSDPRGRSDLAPGTPPAAPSPPAAACVQHSATPAPAAARAREILAELLAYLGADWTVEVHSGDSDGAIMLVVKGENGGLLIGRRGQTLDALEYLLNRMVALGEKPGPLRIGIDVESYRQRRKEYLETLALRLAEKARQTGRVVTLNPMSPRDRRVVHLALRDDRGVATRSQGQGHYRKILIIPAGRVRPDGSEGTRPGG